MHKMIITVAPCAPASHLQVYSDLPRSPEQIAAEVVRAHAAGAAIAHLHVWDEEGAATQDLSAFHRTLALIRERCDIIIEGSTGGLTGFSAADRSVALQTDIELASLNPGSVNYDQGVYINSPQDIDYWVHEMQRKGIKPDVAIFEAGMIENTLHYVRAGLIAEPLLFNFVLGQKGALPATARHLMFLIETVPEDALWVVTGHGGHDLQGALWAIALGGHPRAGYEDNIFYRPGERASSNAQLIERIVRIGREAGREIASPAEARQILNL
jgi:3-keto-5-aminohexanoate cleavage enzyme